MFVPLFLVFIVATAPTSASDGFSEFVSCNPIFVGATAATVLLALLVVITHIGPIRGLYSARYHRCRGEHQSAMALENFYLGEISREEAQKRMKPHGYGLCKVDDQYGMTTLAEMAKPILHKEQLTVEQQNLVAAQNQDLANAVVNFYQLRDGYLAQHSAGESFINSLPRYGFIYDGGKIKKLDNLTLTQTQCTGTTTSIMSSVTGPQGGLTRSIMAKIRSNKKDRSVSTQQTQNTVTVH